MKGICLDCQSISEIELIRTHNYKFPVAGFLLGLGVSTIVYDYGSLDIYILISVLLTLFFILSGLYLLYNYFDAKNKSTESQTSFTFLVLGILLAVWGFLSFLGSVVSPKPLPVIGPLIWLIFGIASIYFYYKDSEKCVNCNKKGMIVPLDNPEAQQIIKENNLSVPE